MFKISLEIVEGGVGSIQEISLEYDSFSLGAGRPNGPGFVSLPSLGGIVSRCHATLFKKSDKWFIRDGNGKPSKNGIWLNFHGWINEPVLLEPGQVFVLAESGSGSIRLKTQPIEETKPGLSPYESTDSSDVESRAEAAQALFKSEPDDLETTELLPPGTSPVILDRIARLEAYLIKSQNHLNSRSIQGQKAASMICGFIAVPLMLFFAGTVLESSEQRGQFRDSFLEAIGGPVGLGTGAGSILSLILSAWVSPSKSDDDVLS